MYILTAIGRSAVTASSANPATFVGNLLIQLPLSFPLPDFVRSAINDIVADRSCRSMLRPILNEGIVNDDCAIN